MSNTNDMFQVDYLPEKKEIRINLPEKVWENIDTVVMTRFFQEILVVRTQKKCDFRPSVPNEGRRPDCPLKLVEGKDDAS